MSRHWPELLAFLELGSATLADLVGVYCDPAAVAGDPVGAEVLMRRVGPAGTSG